ncbi:MAG: DUF371 domain-containing protein [Methanoregula sp.]|nr:DUF371 domain-containing protein [Methanoregula sp.]
MEAQEEIRCQGHPLVLGTHPSTFELTREPHLTTNGNCIIGIAADKGCAGLSPAFKRVLAHDDAILITRLACDGIDVEVRSQGSSQFTLDHPTDMVWRRSRFVCGRTMGIRADQVAATLPRELIRALAKGKEMVVTLVATRPG